MDGLHARPVVIALAVFGAVLASAASFLQTRGKVSARTARALNFAAYALMGASMLLFTFAGLRGSQ